MKTIKFETIKTENYPTNETERERGGTRDNSIFSCLFLSQFSINEENMSVASSLFWLYSSSNDEEVGGENMTVDLFSGEIFPSQFQLKFLSNFPQKLIGTA